MALINLSSSDGQLFQVSRPVCRILKTIDTILQDLGGEEDLVETIPVQNISGQILKLIIEWAEHHQNDTQATDDPEEHKEWDLQFFSSIKSDILFDLITGSHFLGVTRLFDSCTKVVATLISEKPVEEIRRILHVENDFTPEEEEELRKANEWLEK